MRRVAKRVFAQRRPKPKAEPVAARRPAASAARRAGTPNLKKYIDNLNREAQQVKNDPAAKFSRDVGNNLAALAQVSGAMGLTGPLGALGSSLMDPSAISKGITKTMYKNDDIVDAVVTVGLTAAAAVSSALAVLTSWTGVGAVAFGSLATASLATLATYKAVRGSYQGGTRGALVAGTAGAITAGVAAATAGTSSAFGLNLNASYSFHGGYSGGVGVGYGGANVGVNYSEQGGWGGSVGYGGFGVRLGEQGSWGVSAAGLSYDYSRAGGHSYGVDVAGLSNDYGSLTGTLTYNNKTGTGFSVGATLAGAAGGLGANSSASWSRFGPGVQTSFGLSYTSPALAAQRKKDAEPGNEDGEGKKAPGAPYNHEQNLFGNVIAGAGRLMDLGESVGNWASGSGFRTDRDIEASMAAAAAASLLGDAIELAASGKTGEAKQLIEDSEALTPDEKKRMQQLVSVNEKKMTAVYAAYLGREIASQYGIAKDGEGILYAEVSAEINKLAVDGMASQADAVLAARKVAESMGLHAHTDTPIDWDAAIEGAAIVRGIDAERFKSVAKPEIVSEQQELEAKYGNIHADFNSIRDEVRTERSGRRVLPESVQQKQAVQRLREKYSAEEVADYLEHREEMRDLAVSTGTERNLRATLGRNAELVDSVLGSIGMNTQGPLGSVSIFWNSAQAVSRYFTGQSISDNMDQLSGLPEFEIRAQAARDDMEGASTYMSGLYDNAVNQGEARGELIKIVGETLATGGLGALRTALRGTGTRLFGSLARRSESLVAGLADDMFDARRLAGVDGRFADVATDNIARVGAGDDLSHLSPDKLRVFERLRRPVNSSEFGFNLNDINPNPWNPRFQNNCHECVDIFEESLSAQAVTRTATDVGRKRLNITALLRDDFAKSYTNLDELVNEFEQLGPDVVARLHMWEQTDDALIKSAHVQSLLRKNGETFIIDPQWQSINGRLAFEIMPNQAEYILEVIKVLRGGSP